MHLQQQLARLIVGAVTASLMAGCAHYKAAQPAPAAPRGQIDTDITVNVVETDNGVFDFTYAGNFIDQEGNLDFTQGGAERNAVLIRFCLDDETYEGREIRFVRPGRQAIWLEQIDDPAPGQSPSGPLNPKDDQFRGFATERNRQCVHVVDKNDNGKTYLYALRINVPGLKEPVPDDPIIRNSR